MQHQIFPKSSETLETLRNSFNSNTEYEIFIGRNNK